MPKVTYRQSQPRVDNYAMELDLARMKLRRGDCNLYECTFPVITPTQCHRVICGCCSSAWAAGSSPCSTVIGLIKKKEEEKRERRKVARLVRVLVVANSGRRTDVTGTQA